MCYCNLNNISHPESCGRSGCQAPKLSYERQFRNLHNAVIHHRQNNTSKIVSDNDNKLYLAAGIAPIAKPTIKKFNVGIIPTEAVKKTYCFYHWYNRQKHTFLCQKCHKMESKCPKNDTYRCFQYLEIPAEPGFGNECHNCDRTVNYDT
jgi:hypothetical protein